MSGITFGPYRVDPDGQRLWKNHESVPLQPRPLAVLSYLAARPGRVIGRDELIKTLWAGTYVTKAVLKVAVRAIREALEDDADAPRYVETVGREGYRFIGANRDGARMASPVSTTTAPLSVAATDAVVPMPMVGRAPDLAALRTGFDRALDGARHVVFVIGEAGIGKTTLVDRFVADVDREGSAWIARGQCLEQYGEGEPYLPVLEAIGALARDGGAHEVTAVLRRHAPTWVSQLPALATYGTARSREGETVAAMPVGTARSRGGETVGAMPARMLREMADALEVLTQRRALVLVLEDLQWSDRSTVELIACVARRRQTARLMVIGSFRPADLIVHDHPLRVAKQELQATGGCEEIALELLSLADVTAYVDARFGAAASDEMAWLASRVHERTEGNALFMVNMVNDLVAQGVLVRREGHWWVERALEQATDRIPVGLRELIRRRMQGLAPAALSALEVASVAGDEFAVAAVATGFDADAEVVEELCENLASQGALIAEAGIAEWPDGSLTGRYRFLHALYRRVLYEGIGESRRVRLHRAIGLREEVAFGVRVAERAAALAMHFERGRDHVRALKYRELAGSAALERHAPHEAVAHFAAALAALERQPQGPARAERELALVVASATLLMATSGYAASETEQAFARARSLCDALPASPKIFPVLRGLVSYHHVRADLAVAHQLGELLLQHASNHDGDRTLRVQAHYGQGATLFHMGALDAARDHLEHALRDYDPATHRQHIRVYGGYDPGVACSHWLAWTLALQGRLDEAVTRDREGLALARRLADPFSLAWAYQAAAVSQQVFGDWSASETSSAEAIRLAEEYGFPHVCGMAMVNRGWALIMQGNPALGIPVLRDGVAAVDATGAGLVKPQYLGMLAAADLMEGHRDAAAARFAQALAEAERTGERLHKAALLIGKSHLLAGGGRGGKPSCEAAEAAEACLLRALDVARAQGAHLIELRAAVALARHLRKRGRAAEGRALLAAAHACFEDARPGAPEISAARQLLADLG